MQIHIGKYLLVDELILDDKKVIKAYWKDENPEMTDDIYRDEINDFISIVKAKNPHRMLGDMKNFTFTISPETQIWLNEKLFGTYIEIGVDKLAMIVSDDLFSQVSIEQTVEEEETAAFETRYFNNLQEATFWLQN